MNRYKEKYPEKIAAKNHSQHFIKDKGIEVHHWSYNKPHYKNVILLSIADHARIHRDLIYDTELFMYRRSDNNELLNTRELHEAYIKELLSK